MKPGAEQNVIGNLPLGCGLTKQQAEQIYEQGKEAVVFALLQQAKMLAEKNNLPAAIAQDPSTPSSQKPVFTKKNKSGCKRGKKSGRKKGHKGSCRQQPKIDRTVEHRPDRCCDCGEKIDNCSKSHERCIEDIPSEVRVETVRHVIYRGWCKNCKKTVEPIVDDALPKSSIGNGILVLSAWLHYALGNTISQILGVFNFHLQFKMSIGGLVQMWHRLAEILWQWFDEIIEDIQNTGL